MAERSLVYSVQINTGSARSQAAQVRATIESQLRTITTGQINLGNLSLSGFQAAVTDAQELQRQLDLAADQAERLNRANSSGSGSRRSPLAGSDVSAFGAVKDIAQTFGVVLGAQQIARAAIDLSKLGTEAARAGKSFEILVGGADRADVIIRAIQKGSNETVDSLSAIRIGTQAAALGLANTTTEFERLSRAARLVVQISPTINSVQDALTQLALFSSNFQSFQRADQLGLGATEVRDKIKELQAADGNLEDSRAKLLASLDLIEQKFGATASSAEAQASGIERLAVAWRELQIAIATADTGALSEFFSIDKFAEKAAGTFASVAAMINGESTNIEFAMQRVGDSIERLNNQQERFFFPANNTDSIAELSKNLEFYKTVVDNVRAAVDAGAPGAAAYATSLDELSGAIAVSGDINAEQIASLQVLNNWYETVGKSAIDAANAIDEGNAAQAAAEARQAAILEQQDPINKSLSSQAAKTIDTAGIEATLATLKEAKAQVDQAITDLINSAVTDPDEIALRIQQIQDQAGQLFTDLEESANNFSFAGIDQAFAGIFENLNFPEIDFLPGLESLRDEVMSLYETISESGYVTEEQAALLDYYSSAASAAADSTSGVTQVVDELGGAFIEQNQLVGDLISQLYLTEAAYNAGQISAEQFAGRTAALGGQLLAYIQQVGGATSATYALIAAQSGMRGTSGFITGFGQGSATGSYLKAQDDARAREQARRDAERARKEAENAAKKAAREAESAAKRAANELEKGAKKARQELESALKNVPGLFSRSQVTQGQLDQAKSGVPQNFADDYIRRLEDEVFNGNDWQDVSIDEARSSLQALGVQVSNDNKVAFQQFAEAWESGLLFFDADNVAKFINAEAVQASLDLQEKARIGQENIMKAFGVAIDDAADAAVSGISAASGGASGSFTDGEYTVPVTAELIPIPDKEFEPGGAFAPVVKPVIQPQVQGPLPKSAFMPTLGGVSPVIDVAAIQGELNTLAITPTIDTSAIDFAAAKAEIEAGLSVTAKVVATGFQAQAFLDANLIKETLTPHITATIDGVGFTVAGLTEIDQVGAAMSERLKSSIASNVGTTKWDDDGIVAPIATGLVTAINTQVRGTSFEPVGASVAEYLKSSIASNVATTQWSDDGIIAPIAAGLVTAINTQIRGTQDGFKREGQGIASLVMYGMSQGWREVNADGSATNSLATGLLSELNNQLSANQNFFFAAGQTPASNLIDGYKNFFGGGSDQAAELITPLLSAIGTGIRANIEGFRQRGGTVAREMIGGFSAQFNSEEFKTTLIAAGETMASYLTIGILSGINGGQLVEAIGAQVLADITATVEEPTP